MKTLIKGTVHLHSNFSDDGALPIEEFANHYKSKDYNFICLTDHIPDNSWQFINQKKMDKIVAECQLAGSSHFIIRQFGQKRTSKSSCA